MINTSNTNTRGLGVISFMLRNVDVLGPDRRLCMRWELVRARELF